MTTIPDRTEAAPYYFAYIDKVPEGDIVTTLGAQLSEALTLLSSIPEADSLRRYAPDKWSIRELVSHISDTERVFAFRALWFARGFESRLPSFDQTVAVATAGADARSLARHIDEFQSVRTATISLFANLADEAWLRRGVASDNPFSVRALAFLAAGHVTHHLTILRERYLSARLEG